MQPSQVTTGHLGGALRAALPLIRSWWSGEWRVGGKMCYRGRSDNERPDPHTFTRYVTASMGPDSALACQMAARRGSHIAETEDQPNRREKREQGLNAEVDEYQLAGLSSPTAHRQSPLRPLPGSRT